ncbi:MAG: chemotaxis protein CheA [Deltaproteobacteria bacterium]|nr:chemotaxis protein CheA [Deltaproteobacteria bacterium]
MRDASERNADEFLAEADEILEGVAEDLLLLEASAGEGEAEPEVINSIFRGAHSLKGISGMFGFVQVTEVSHKMETLLDSLRMGRTACSRSTIDLLFEGVDLLKSLCTRIGSGLLTDDPKVAPFVERLLGACQGAETDPQDPVAALGLAEDVLRVLTEYELHRLRTTLKDPKRKLIRVRATLPLSSFDSDLEALNKALRPCGEIISTLPAPGAPADEALEFDLLLGAKSSLDDVRAACGPFRTDLLTLPPPDGAKIPPAEPGQPPAPADPDVWPEERALLESGSEAADAPARIRARGEGDLRSLTKTIRVDLPKLDALMNLVGELVLTKGRIQILSEKLRERMGFTGDALELTKAQKELERKLSELQQAVMEVRMIPLGQVFSKLHRVMRKILQGTTKEADLEIFGAETELDKLIVEDLSDPLVQIIRNAVDHGIEEPQVRISRGKPVKGTVRICARQRGNHVVIEVSDDGAGLSRERIRAKGLEKGLIQEGTILDEKELLDLVFIPGFSTREEVTEISGRGVGMDVVRRNIANLSGLIELSSVEGKGTTITIILPITLAIIQALLVDAHRQTYAIPLNSVLETLAVEPGQVKAIEGRPVLHLREQTLPLVRIDSLFGVRPGEAMPAYAVVVGIAEKRAAFAVDNLISQRDVVIKSLGRRLQSLRGIAGATDVGDQRTILVLDVAALVDQVFAAA